MKKLLKITLLIMLVAVLSSCDSVRVATDYDREANFNSYETFAFYKPGIDKAEISDLDKKRILRAIETELEAKGMTKSENPDLLVSIFTKTVENVNIYQNPGYYGYAWGWRPYYWGTGYNTVSRTTEGTLYIDLIDAQTMNLVWQGMGTGALELEMEDKIERINEIVSQILAKYPPGKE
ncbi:MAG TPA: DUF4136 domain-containing protein [Flavobacteriaceae bacterium]|nr:DUF4136 domain-containing protein [Flavobacteriaceae bacterium]